MSRFILLAVVLIGELYGQTTSGTINSDATWFPGDTIVVTDDITVTDGAVLTIRPGTAIRGMLESEKIRIEGASGIRAVGNLDSLISFNRIQITFEGITRDSVNTITYSAFENGMGNPFLYFYNPTDSMIFPAVFIEDCTFKDDNWTAVYILRGSSPTFRNCVFDGPGTGMFIHGGKNIDISYSTFANNSCGIFIASLQMTYMPWEPGIVDVNHCTFHNMTGTRATTVTEANGYGIFTSQMPGSLTVTNSVFHTMDHSGIRDYNADDSNFDVPWRIDNDYNCFYNCTDSSCRGLAAGPHSITGDPLFIDGAAGDFSLESGSPCLNAGSDGAHIGAWQGMVGIRNYGYAAPVTTLPDGMQGPMYDLRGRIHRTDRMSTGIYFTVNETSRLVTKRLIMTRSR